MVNTQVVVVVTPDAVLVTSKAHSGQVKDLVGILRTKTHPEADAHRRMYRPWGWYQRVDIGERFQVKRIMVTPGGQLSLQKHFHRAEHWLVVKGTAEVTLNDAVVLVHENEAIYLPIGSMHRLTNPGKIPLELIEVLHLAEGQAVQYSTEVFAPGSVDLHVIRGLAG